MVGDVCGHGADEAALGVELRVAWRALMLAGVADDAVLPRARAGADQRAPRARRSSPRWPRSRSTWTGAGRRYGSPGTRRRCCSPAAAVGCRPGHATARCSACSTDADRPADHVRAARRDWALLLYTDGLIEGRSGAGDDAARTWPGCCELIDRARPAAAMPLAAAAGLAGGQAEQANGGPLADDVAMLLCQPRGWPVSRDRSSCGDASTSGRGPSPRVTALCPRRRGPRWPRRRRPRPRGQPRPADDLLNQHRSRCAPPPTTCCNALVDQETAVRGYVLTRQRDRPGPYREGLARRGGRDRGDRGQPGGHPDSARAQLARCAALGRPWRGEVAEPAIAPVRRGRAAAAPGLTDDAHRPRSTDSAPR